MQIQSPCSLTCFGSGSRSDSSFKMNNFWTFPLSIQENLICLYIDMVNVVLDLTFVLGTLNYNKVYPVI